MGDEAPVFALLKSNRCDLDDVVRSALATSGGPGPNTHASLGPELPTRIGRLAEGLIYGIECNEQAVRLPLLAAALLASLRSGKPCTLLTPCDPGMFLRKARLAGRGLEDWMKRGELTIFRFPRDAAKHLLRAGTERLLAELEQSIPRRDSFLVIDQADALFVLADPHAAAQAAQRYADWASSRGHAVLAAFAPGANTPRDYLSLRHIADNFGGFALARPAHRGAVFEIRHWFAVAGASSRESFELRFDGSSMLGVWSAKSPCEDDLPLVDKVIWVTGAIDDAAAGDSWHQAESIADALDAAQCSESAILLLPFRCSEEHETLCHSVMEVRAMARASLRVMVRECGTRLRASQALILIRLGASSIIPADLPDAGVKRIVDMLQGTRFARPYDTDLRELEQEITGVSRRTISGAATFCDAVERLLAAADGFDIESSLARVELDRAEPARLMSRAERLARELVVLVQGKKIWLFLFGCPASAAPAVMTRLLGAPMEQSCSSSSILDDAESIFAELHKLRER